VTRRRGVDTGFLAFIDVSDNINRSVEEDAMRARDVC